MLTLFACLKCLFGCFHKLFLKLPITFVSLNKLVAIWIVMQFLLTNTDMVQIFKLPYLFQHYFNHCDESTDDSFFSYLKEHYGIPSQASDATNPEHDQLPFKSHTGIHIQWTGEVMFSTNTLLPLAIIWEAPQKACHVVVQVVASFCGNIWQPPKR